MPPPPLRPARPLVPNITRTILAQPLRAPTMTRAQVEALVAELRRLRSEVNRYVHRMGVIYRQLSQAECHAAVGVPDFEQLLDHYDLGARLTALKYIAVAASFTEAQAAQLGVERGYAIVRGAAAMAEPVEPRALLAQNPEITVGPERARLAAAPLRTLLGWVGTLTAGATPAPSKRAYKDADSVRDKLHRRLASAGIGEARMRVVRRGNGYVVRVELGPEEAAALVRLVKPA